jgi:hypothetical protein
MKGDVLILEEHHRRAAGEIVRQIVDRIRKKKRGMSSRSPENPGAASRKPLGRLRMSCPRADLNPSSWGRTIIFSFLLVRMI